MFFFWFASSGYQYFFFLFVVERTRIGYSNRSWHGFDAICHVGLDSNPRPFDPESNSLPNYEALLLLFDIYGATMLTLISSTKNTFNNELHIFPALLIGICQSFLFFVSCFFACFFCLIIITKYKFFVVSIVTGQSLNCRKANLIRATAAAFTT